MICQQCGGEILNPRSLKFCSVKCRKKHWKQQNKDKVKRWARELYEREGKNINERRKGRELANPELLRRRRESKLKNYYKKAYGKLWEAADLVVQVENETGARTCRTSRGIQPLTIKQRGKTR